MNEKILDEMLKIAEEFFGTEDDPEQMPINIDSFYKLQKLHPKTIIYRLENNKPISWVVVLPTSNDLADKFIKGEINEKQLLDMTEQQDIFEAIYLCSAFTLPEHRRKGYVIEMFKEAIDAIPHSENVRLFAWAYSKEGGKLLKKIEELLRIKIDLKEK